MSKRIIQTIVTVGVAVIATLIMLAVKTDEGSTTSDLYAAAAIVLFFGMIIVILTWTMPDSDDF